MFKTSERFGDGSMTGVTSSGGLEHGITPNQAWKVALSNQRIPKDHSMNPQPARIGANAPKTSWAAARPWIGCY